MPRLPTAEDLGGRPVPSGRGAITPLRLETPSLGQHAKALADFGESVKGVGDTLAIMAEKEKKEMDATRAEEATTKYLNGLLELEMGEKDGYENVKGGDAVNRPLIEEYRKKRDELSQQIRGGLGNKDQMTAFDQRAQIADRQFDARLYRHIADQSRAYKGAVFEGTKATERRMAALNWDQPGQIELSILRTQKEIERKALEDGLNPEREGDRQTIDTLKVIAETQIHSDVVDQMLLQGKDAAASAYYERIKPRLTPEAIITLGDKVHSGSIDGTAMRSADMAWSTLGPKMPNDPVRLDLMENWIREKHSDDPRIVRSAINELRSRAVAHNDAQQELTASNKAKVLDAYGSQGKTLKEIQQMPEWWSLSGDERSALQDYIVNRGYTTQQRARSEQEYLEGQKSKAGFQTFWELSNPRVLSTLSESQILALEPQLGRTIVGDLMQMRRKLDTPEKLQAATIDTDMFNSIAAEAGLTPYNTNNSAEQKEYLGRLRNRIETSIDIAQRQTNHELTREDKEKIMRLEIDRKVMIDGWGGLTTSTLPAGAVKPNQREKVYVPIGNINQTWLKNALNYMRSMGVFPMEWSDAKATKVMKDRLEHAYGVSVTGGSAEEGKRALEGK